VLTVRPPLEVHDPKSGWQPVPQWSVVLPHQPYCEQHSPDGHCLPLLPHWSSVLTGRVDELPADEVVDVDEPPADVEEDELPAAVVVVELPLLVPEQEPNPAWQPVPQYAVPVPHQPY
jgi:hypothetical protein